jgi:hypothetical protein
MFWIVVSVIVLIAVVWYCHPSTGCPHDYELTCEEARCTICGHKKDM